MALVTASLVAGTLLVSLAGTVAASSKGYSSPVEGDSTCTWDEQMQGCYYASAVFTFEYSVTTSPYAGGVYYYFNPVESEARIYGAGISGGKWFASGIIGRYHGTATFYNTSGNPVATLSLGNSASGVCAFHWISTSNDILERLCTTPGTTIGSTSNPPGKVCFSVGFNTTFLYPDNTFGYYYCTKLYI
jgi:hypothetical protein